MKVLALLSAATAGVAYILGIMLVSRWVWALVLSAEANQWYGIREIPVLRELLAVLFAFALFFGGVYVFVILPVLVIGFVHEGIKRSSGFF